MYPWSKFWRTRVIISSMLIYHCVDLHLRVETFFEKDEAAENGGVDFEIGDLPLLHTCIEGWRKFHEETVRSLIDFSWQKIAFKSSLDLHFIPSLLRSESRKKIHTEVVITCLKAPEEGLFCFPGRNWEGVSRSLFSLVKLYQRIWI